MTSKIRIEGEIDVEALAISLNGSKVNPASMTPEEIKAVVEQGYEGVDHLITLGVGFAASVVEMVPNPHAHQLRLDLGRAVPAGEEPEFMARAVPLWGGA